MTKLIPPSQPEGDFVPSKLELEDTIKEAVESQTQQIKTGGGYATDAEIALVVDSILKTKKEVSNDANRKKIVASISYLAQEGATSPKFADSRSCSLFGIEVRVSDVRNACKTHGTTIRKLARGLRNQVIQVAENFKLEGNLSKLYKLDNPGYDQQDLIWASDIQTFSNDPRMPEQVKSWLLTNYRNRFKPIKSAPEN